MMSTHPATPCFDVSKKRHAIELQNELETKCMVTRLSLIIEVDLIYEVYDADGLVWTFRWERPAAGYGFWDKLINFFHNPLQKVAVTWKMERMYDLEELRVHFLDAIDHDDDCLCQFVKAPEIKARVSQCVTFEDLVNTWEWMSTEQPCDE